MPRTSGTSGTSQIRNCGESTFPNATKAQTAAADARTRRSRVAGPRANQIQVAISAAACSTVWTVASASGPLPARFCEPWPERIVIPSPPTACATSRTPAPSVSICSGRLVCVVTLCQTPSGASTTNGRKQASTTAANTARQTSASRRPLRRQTHTAATGTSTAGKIFAATASPSTPEPSRSRPATKRRQRTDRQRRRPEVETGQHDRAEQQRRERREAERGAGAHRACLQAEQDREHERERERPADEHLRLEPAAVAAQVAVARERRSDGITKAGSAAGGYSSRKSR